MKSAKVPAVHVDFHNADAEGFVRLNSVGAIEDLSRLKVNLTDGLQLRASDGEIIVRGVVSRPGPEGVWRLRVDWAEIFRKHGRKK